MSGSGFKGDAGTQTEVARTAPQVSEAKRNAGLAANDPLYDVLNNETLKQNAGGTKGRFNGVAKNVVYLGPCKTFRLKFSNLNFMAEEPGINELHK